MRSDEYHSPVDGYFKMHESDISVVYDPEHWRRLAAALDAGHQTPASKLPPDSLQRNTRRFWGKHWWISGFVILIVLTSDWVGSRQASPAPVLLAPSIPALSPMESTNEGSAEKQSTPSQKTHQVLTENKTPSVFSVTDSTNEVSIDLETMPARLRVAVPVGDSAQMLDTMKSTLQPVSADSTLLDSIQVKRKKKNLFW